MVEMLHFTFSIKFLLLDSFLIEKHNLRNLYIPCQQNLQYADCISCKGVRPLQKNSSFGDLGVGWDGIPLHCHYSQVHSDLEW